MAEGLAPQAVGEAVKGSVKGPVKGILVMLAKLLTFVCLPLSFAPGAFG